METTSRFSIHRKIRNNDVNSKPKSPNLTEKLVKKLTSHFEKDLSYLTKFKQLEIIYSLVDRIIDGQSAMTVCRKGCSYCCTLAVEITPLEAEYIAENTEHVIQQPSDEGVKLDYCPLHKDGLCTVYEYRPFNCRAFVTYDSPDYCRDGKSHFTNGGPKNGWGHQGLLELGLQMVEIDTDTKLSPETYKAIKQRVRDIRSFFKRP